MGYEEDYGTIKGFLRWWKGTKWKYLYIEYKALEPKDRYIGFSYTYYDGPFYSIGLWFGNWTLHDQWDEKNEIFISSFSRISNVPCSFRRSRID